MAFLLFGESLFETTGVVIRKYDGSDKPILHIANAWTSENIKYDTIELRDAAYDSYIDLLIP
jgi:hypothetical protein